MNEDPIKKWESLPEDDQNLVQRTINGISTGEERDNASVEVKEALEELREEAQQE